MAVPHPALIDLAQGRPLPPLSSPEELLRSAHEHRMTGLLWSRVESDQSLGGSWRTTVARETLLVRARHQRLWAAMAKVVRRLDAIGVEVAVAKGVTAEARWYDRMGERPCLDIDLLVSPSDLHRMGDIVGELQPEHPFREQVQRLFDREMIQSVDVLSEDGVWLDIHSDILKFDIPSRQRQLIWERTVQVGLLDGGTVKALDPEVSLVQFLLHLNKDRFRCLLGYMDVAHILEREQLDWDFIERFLRTEGLEVHADMTLNVVASTLGLAVPQARAWRDWRARVWILLWPPAVRLQGDLGFLRFQRRQFWIPLTARGRAREAIRRLFQRLFPPPELLAFSHPETKGPYLWRLIAGRVRMRLKDRRLARRMRRLPAPSRGRAP